MDTKPLERQNDDLIFNTNWKVIINSGSDTNLFILISRHSNEYCFGKCESLKITVRVFVRVVRSYNVNTRLVLMHGVQNCLKERRNEELNRPSATMNKQK